MEVTSIFGAGADEVVLVGVLMDWGGGEEGRPQAVS